MPTPDSAAGAGTEPARREPATRSPVEALRRLRQEQIEALARAAIEDPDNADKLAARVKSLSEAIEAIEKGVRETRGRRLAVAAVTAAIIATGTLLLLHRPSTAILADTAASHLSFTVSAPFAPLRGVEQVAFVEITSLARVRQESGAEVSAPPDEDLLLRVQPDPASKHPGSIGFDELTVPVGTQIEMDRIEPGNAVELRFQYPHGASPELNLDVSGDVAIRLQGQHRASFPAPVRITAIPAGDAQLTVDFHSRETAFPSPIRVGAVSFSRDVRAISREPAGALEQSSILSGKLSLEEFRDRTVNLRSGEVVRLGGASGVIRQLRSDGEKLSSQFDGSVRELSTGEAERKQNLMPTWLDWLRQRDALVQFWAVAAYLAGLGMAVGRWWKGPR